VHAIAGPQLAELGRLEAAEGPGRLAVGPDVEAETGEVALNGSLRDLGSRPPARPAASAAGWAG